ncbi:MAG: molybdopterin-guanine dinucleotide biosynthesis protein B [Thermodesulfobacteriota bacterium]
MKVVGVVGYKKSGKTALILGLSKELSAMGYKVGVLKHVPDTLELADADTSKFRAHAGFVAGISPKETELLLQGKKRIEDILAYSNADIILVEGFKKEKTFPKIVCIRSKDEEEDLFDGLQLFTASLEENLSEFHILNEEHVKKMAVIAAERSFKLPNLNCGHCGYETCYELAMEIVKGNKSTANCVSLHPQLTITVDGTQFPLNPFMSNLFKNSFVAMLSSLKGFKKGRIEIKIPPE